MKAVILLATYQGATYLREQLESLRRQTHANWELWIRDDGSRDGTLEVLRNFPFGDNRVQFLEAGEKPLGPAASFGRLLEAALAAPSREERAFFFCDQDDIWKPWKIAACLAALRGRDGPEAVFTDLEVVGPQLEPIAPSFRALAKLEKRSPNALPLLVAQNYVTGCALAFNEAMAHLALPLPPQVLMHDWWIALLAASRGELIDLPEASVLYRQHAVQASGGVRGRRLARFVKLLAQGEPLLHLMTRRFAQTRALEQRLRERNVDEDSSRFLEKFHGGAQLLWPFSALKVAALGVRMQTLARSLVYYFVLGAVRGRLRRQSG